MLRPSRGRLIPQPAVAFVQTASPTISYREAMIYFAPVFG